jgi:hypothetical protein
MSSFSWREKGTQLNPVPDRAFGDAQRPSAFSIAAGDLDTASQSVRPSRAQRQSVGDRSVGYSNSGRWTQNWNALHDVISDDFFRAPCKCKCWINDPIMNF